jgi:hypothetical protein
MGPIQNMEAMFQTWKNLVLKKDLHLGPIGFFYYECTCLFMKNSDGSKHDWGNPQEH